MIIQKSRLCVKNLVDPDRTSPTLLIGMSCSSFPLTDGAPHSENRALASKSAAAFAASKVSALSLAIKSSRLLPALALRLTSHVGTPSCVNTNNIKSPTSVQTAGSGHRAGSGCHSESAESSSIDARNHQRQDC